MIIYRILNKINNKSYIGQSVLTFNKRYKGGQWWKYIKKNNLESPGKNYWQKIRKSTES